MWMIIIAKLKNNWEAITILLVMAQERNLLKSIMLLPTTRVKEYLMFQEKYSLVLLSSLLVLFALAAIGALHGILLFFEI